jgi:hypothetical protein
VGLASITNCEQAKEVIKPASTDDKKPTDKT